MGDRDETSELEPVETPATYQVAERRVFGVAPTGALPLFALALLVAGVAFLATGNLVAGLALLLAGLAFGALFLEQARRRRASRLDRFAATAVDRSLAFAGFAGGSVSAWTGAGREVTRLRLEAQRCTRDKTQLLHELGVAAYRKDEAEVASLRARIAELDGRIELCARRAQAAVEGARRRASRERLAVASTEIRKPRA